jgi:hypothetical protein
LTRDDILIVFVFQAIMLGTVERPMAGWVVEKELFTERAQVERKLLTFSLMENPRGRFLRITEDVGGRRDTIIVPAAGLEQVRDIIERAVAADRNSGPLDAAKT